MFRTVIGWVRCVLGLGWMSWMCVWPGLVGLDVCWAHGSRPTQ